MKAISIRQPWAWLIVNGYKDIENRTWNTKYRGQVLIHAASGLTKHEYNAALEICRAINPNLPVNIPSYESIERGGIVGYAYITGTCESNSSPWFFGPVGFYLTGAKPLHFQPLKGKLSFFETGYGVVAAGRKEALIPEINLQGMKL